MKDKILELVQKQEVGAWYSHECPFCQDGKNRRILSIKKDNKGIVSKCWSTNCEAYGIKYWGSSECSPEVVKHLLKKTEEENKYRKYDLPEIVYDIPEDYMEYLREYYIDNYLIRKYCIGYCHEHWWGGKLRFKDRLIIPTPSGFVARSNTEQPKWRNYTNYDFKSKVQTGDCVVLVEDPISCIRVGEVMPCITLFGTKIKFSVSELVKQYNNVILWTDDDTAGKEGILKMKRQLDPYITCTIVRTNKDPKCYSTNEIKETLNEDK